MSQEPGVPLYNAVENGPRIALNLLLATPSSRFSISFAEQASGEGRESSCRTLVQGSQLKAHTTSYQGWVIVPQAPTQEGPGMQRWPRMTGLGDSLRGRPGWETTTRPPPATHTCCCQSTGPLGGGTSIYAKVDCELPNPETASAACVWECEIGVLRGAQDTRLTASSASWGYIAGMRQSTEPRPSYAHNIRHVH